MPTVYMSIGVPGAGKTTYWKQFVADTGAVYASPDDIRTEMLGDYRYRNHQQNLEVWDKIFGIVQDGLLAGRDVVVDGAYIERHYRRDDIARYRRWGANKVVGYWFKTPVDVAVERNRARKLPLPDDVITKADARLAAEAPELSDGFDELRVEPS
jgi:predicted kinase